MVPNGTGSSPSQQQHEEETSSINDMALAVPVCLEGQAKVGLIRSCIHVSITCQSLSCFLVCMHIAPFARQRSRSEIRRQTHSTSSSLSRSPPHLFALSISFATLFFNFGAEARRMDLTASLVEQTAAESGSIESMAVAIARLNFSTKDDANTTPGPTYIHKPSSTPIMNFPLPHELR